MNPERCMLESASLYLSHPGHLHPETAVLGLPPPLYTRATHTQDTSRSPLSWVCPRLSTLARPTPRTPPVPR